MLDLLLTDDLDAHRKRYSSVLGEVVPRHCDETDEAYRQRVQVFVHGVQTEADEEVLSDERTTGLG